MCAHTNNFFMWDGLNFWIECGRCKKTSPIALTAAEAKKNWLTQLDYEKQSIPLLLV